MTADAEMRERFAWRDHLPLLVSGSVAANFLLHLLVLAQGNLDIAGALIQADPVRVAFQSVLFMMPSLVVLAALFLATEVATRSQRSLHTTLSGIGLFGIGIVSLRSQSVVLLAETWLQVLAVVTVGRHSKGGFNRLLPYRYRHYRNMSEEVLSLQARALRRSTSILKRANRKMRRRVFILMRLPTALGLTGVGLNITTKYPRATLAAKRVAVIERAKERYSPEFFRNIEEMWTRDYTLAEFERDRSQLDLAWLRESAKPVHVRSGDFRPRWSRASSLIAQLSKNRLNFLALNLAINLVLHLSTAYVLPLERVEVESRRPIVGYVIARDVSETVVLQKEPRMVIFLKTVNVKDRTLCTDNTGRVAWLDYTVIPRPALPNCDS